MLSTTELSCMQTTAELSMMDTGYIQTYSRTFDAYGAPVETWTEGANSVSCGVDMRTGAERHGREDTVTEYDAKIRLPLDTVIGVKDRIRITHRYGRALTTPIVYSVYSPISTGVSCVTFLAKRFET